MNGPCFIIWGSDRICRDPSDGVYGRPGGGGGPLGQLGGRAYGS